MATLLVPENTAALAEGTSSVHPGTLGGPGSWFAEVAERLRRDGVSSPGALLSGQHRAVRDGDPGGQPRRGGLAQGYKPLGAGADDPLPEEGGEGRELRQRCHAAGLGEAFFSSSVRSPGRHSGSPLRVKPQVQLVLCSAPAVTQGEESSCLKETSVWEQAGRTAWQTTGEGGEVQGLHGL